MIDISPGNLDSSLCFSSPAFLMIYSAHAYPLIICTLPGIKYMHWIALRESVVWIIWQMISRLLRPKFAFNININYISWKYKKLCYFCACVLSHVWFLVISWTIDSKDPCPWDFPRQDTGVGCHFLLQGNLTNPGIESTTPVSPALQVNFFYRWAIREAHIMLEFILLITWSDC